MRQLTIHTNFSTLRNVYLEVKQFIESETGENNINLKTTLINNLGLHGEDNYDLLSKFIARYKLRLDGFNYSKHFNSETEVFNNGMVFIRILFFPFFFSIWLIRIIGAKGKNWRSIEFYPKWKGPHRLDLSIGDLVIWKLSNNYNLRANTRVIFE